MGYGATVAALRIAHRGVLRMECGETRTWMRPVMYASGQTASLVRMSMSEMLGSLGHFQEVLPKMDSGMENASL